MNHLKVNSKDIKIDIENVNNNCDENVCVKNTINSWVYKCYNKLVEYLSAKIRVCEFLCVSVDEFCWVTLRVTDESANHTISNTIKHYWFDCGWVFNEMPQLYIIETVPYEMPMVRKLEFLRLENIRTCTWSKLHTVDHYREYLSERVCRTITALYGLA